MSIGKVSRIIDKSGTKADVVDLENYAIPIHVATRFPEEETNEFSSEEWMENTTTDHYNVFPTGLYTYIRNYYNKKKSFPFFKITKDLYAPYETNAMQKIISFSYIGCCSADFDLEGGEDTIYILVRDNEHKNSFNVDNGQTLKEVSNSFVDFEINIIGDESCKVSYTHGDDMTTYLINSGEQTTYSINSVDGNSEEIQLRNNFDEQTTFGGVYFDPTIILPPIPSDTEE